MVIKHLQKNKNKIGKDIEGEQYLTTCPILYEHPLKFTVAPIAESRKIIQISLQWRHLRDDHILKYF